MMMMMMMIDDDDDDDDDCRKPIWLATSESQAPFVE